MSQVSFSVRATVGRARAGLLRTPHGDVPTPAFMPVGTQGTVKALTPADLRAAGADIVLANTYHLGLRPGAERVRAAGGLHRLMAWSGPILTDSGGYQAFSLARARPGPDGARAPLARIGEDGVVFRSHLDGARCELTPERALAIQDALGSDVAMVLDQCPPGDAPDDVVRAATDRTTRWAERSVRARPPGLAGVFGIVQGGTDVAARRAHLAAIAALPLDGLALGGLAVGEPAADRARVLDGVVHHMPSDRPRYLMGLGQPEDITAAVRAGIDLFDCVLPTRGARHGQLYTARGKLNLGNARFADDLAPPDPDCRCETCATFSRAYLHHLFRARELLWHRLASLHNLTFYLGHLRRLRETILAGEPV